jgi:hypothetical protein
MPKICILGSGKRKNYFFSSFKGLMAETLIHYLKKMNEEVKLSRSLKAFHLKNFLELYYCGK